MTAEARAGGLGVNSLDGGWVYAARMGDSLTRLHAAVVAARDADPSTSRTARLLRSGRGKVAKKLAEEAVEVVIDAVNNNKDDVIRESADLLYNLVVLWVSTGIRPDAVWREMERRERLFGIAEKLPKNPIRVASSGPRRAAAMQSRAALRKRR